MLRSYDTMVVTARRHPEGSLVYIIEQTDLYLRVRDGVRQVHVIIFFFDIIDHLLYDSLTHGPYFPLGF